MAERRGVGPRLRNPTGERPGRVVWDVAEKSGSRNHWPSVVSQSLAA